MRKLILTIFTTVLTFTLGFSAGFIPFNGADSQGGLSVKTTDANYNSASLQIEIDGVIIDKIEANGEQFSRLYWENCGVSGEIGEPEIPAYRLFLEIPWNAEVEISVVNISRREYRLEELTVRGRIMPVQPPLEKLPGARNEFRLHQDAYSRNSYINHPLAEVEDYIIVRGRRIAVITLKPLDYNPGAGTVSLAESADIRLRFSGGDLGRTFFHMDRYNSLPFNRLVSGMIANPGIFETDELPDPPALLIICANNPNWLAALQELVDWKHSKGFHTTLVSTAVTGGSANEIKNYITDAYNSWDIPPTFVLLVGETNQIPIFIGQGSGNPETDLYYAAIDGPDYFPDLGVSRFSPANLAQLQNMIDKTLSYEQVGWSGNDTWEKYAVFMASNDNWSVSEGTHNYVISHYLDPAGYSYDRLYSHTYSATTQQVTNSFNAGRSQGTYSGHGSTTGWADGPPFSQANVYALVNEVYPVVQSYACLTGKFAETECFGETWIRHSAGAVVFCGSSVTSYWGEDDILEKSVYEGIYDNQTPGDTVNFTWVNGFTDYGKMRFYDYYGPGGTTQRYFEMYNVLGDGSVDLWTDVPQVVTVNHPAVVFLGTSTVEVGITGQPGWTLVCAHSTAEEDVWASGYADASGNITLHFSTAPVMPGEMVFTVTGHDVHTYIVPVALIPASGPYVVFDSYELDDSGAWNPNGSLDYDESVLLDMTLQNVGLETASGVTATIRSDDAYVTITDSTASFGDIAMNGTSTAIGAFAFSVSGAVHQGHIIDFDITAQSGALSWTTGFSLTANAPAISVEQVIVHDEGNMALDPGETADLEIFLLNEGGSDAFNIENLVSTVDPYVTITSNTANYGAIPATSSVSAEISVSVSAACPQEHEVAFNCAISGDHDYSAEDSFELTVGDILNLPTGPDNYGYSAYDMFDPPLLPDYEWVEICADSGGPGTLINFTLDDQVFQFPLPFTFRYYGVEYDSFTVGANGWISPGINTVDDYSNSSIPNSDGPARMIAPYWEDLSPQRTNSGKVWRWFDASSHLLYVEYNHIEQYSPTGSFETFEVILYDPDYYPTTTGDGGIKFQYKDMSATAQNEGTVGIENHLQNDGLQYLYDGDYDIHAHPLANGAAILFSMPTEVPSLEVTLTPFGTPIVIPPGGGIFEYNLNIENIGDETVIFDGWTEADLPTGPTFGPILLRERLTLAPGAAINRDMMQNVPANAPMGNYTYRCNAGNHPGTVFASDEFGFSKSGVDLSQGEGEWWTSGWELEGEATASLLPDHYYLDQNAPNPFNPVTTINFGLPDAGMVEFRVFNLMGQEVYTLDSQYMTAGHHKITFDASGMSSGIYFYMLKTSDFSKVRKMLLVK